MSSPYSIENVDGIDLLQSLEDNSVDLILTDPPYITSRDSGMDKHYNDVIKGTCAKTEEDWIKWSSKSSLQPFKDEQKQNFLEYGTIYGKKYAVRTQYGDWDSTFTIEKLNEFIQLFYRKLKKGGTCIIFFDLWKITTLKELLEKAKFKQIRFIEWIKTNPQPLNSKTNYLTNCREIALTCVKYGKPTFHSSYDNGMYQYPIQGGKIRTHPTQKNMELFKQLIQKHSNEGDTVVDPFLGSGTTLFACNELNRKFKGSEIDPEFYELIINHHTD